jgi:hypothetical protein
VWNAIKAYSGQILVGIGAALVAVAIVVIFALLSRLGAGAASATTLPLLAIGGVIVLVLLLTAVAMIFSILGLTNQGQAMGLPEGSIRAVIALSLIVLFAILSVFLYQTVSSGTVSTIENMSGIERAKFLADHSASIRELQAPQLKDAAGQPLKAQDGSDLYNITYRVAADPRSDEFAKELLVLLGTLMTAVTSFYLGAGTATSAAASAQGKTAGPPPTISSIDPKAHTISPNSAVISLTILGANLNTITNVKIVRGATQIVATNVASNPTRVTCDIPVSAETAPPDGPWDVVVDDGASQVTTLKGALLIKPAEAESAAPTITSVAPPRYSVATGRQIPLIITGNNLENVRKIKIVRESTEIAGTEVMASGTTSVTCNMPVSAETTPPDGPWDVVVGEGEAQATAKAALTITA